MDNDTQVTKRWSTVKEVIEIGDKYLEENAGEEWTKLKKNTAQSVVSHAKSILAAPPDICRKYETPAKSVVKLGTKSIPKIAVELLTTTTVQTTVKAVTTMTLKETAKSTLKMATSPLGVSVIADLLQAGLEYAGYKEVGKKVGAVGNMAGGAMMGFALWGLPGAGIGATLGGGIWLLGEVAGRAFEKMIER